MRRETLPCRSTDSRRATRLGSVCCRFSRHPRPPRREGENRYGDRPPAPAAEGEAGGVISPPISVGEASRTAEDHTMGTLVRYFMVILGSCGSPAWACLSELDCSPHDPLIGVLVDVVR